MTKRYGIGILACTVMMCAAYWASYQFMIEEPKAQVEQSTEQIQTKTVLGSQDERVYQYYLVEENGYVSVYLDDKVTLYETTSISVKQLPERLQEEIKRGKGLADDHELYNFLENYSS